MSLRLYLQESLNDLHFFMSHFLLLCVQVRLGDEGVTKHGVLKVLCFCSNPNLVFNSKSCFVIPKNIQKIGLGIVKDGEQATEAERKGANGCDRLDSSLV